jgi:hypothetical protein
MYFKVKRRQICKQNICEGGFRDKNYIIAFNCYNENVKNVVKSINSQGLP